MLGSKKFSNLGQNDRIILSNTFFAFLIKGFALIVSFLTAPAFINYFNDNVILGLWYTLLSVLAWFLNFDLGIGNGVRNELVKAFSAKDYVRAKKIISSGLFSISLVTIVLFLIGLVFIVSFDLNSFFNVSSSLISSRVLVQSTILIFAAIMLRFLLTIVTSIFYALQKSSINNFLALCVSVLQLIVVLVFRFENSEQSLLFISFAYFLVSNIPVIVAAFLVFHKKLKFCRPSFAYIEKSAVLKVISVGGSFFYCQILYMIIINTNEFFVTRYFGPSFTAEYSFYYKLTMLIPMLVSLAMTPIWSVVTKASSENNFIWLNKLYKRINLIALIGVVFQFLLVPFTQMIMNLWLGQDFIIVNSFTSLSFAFFGACFTYSTVLSTIVCGLAQMKLQAIIYSLGVLFKILLIPISSKFTDYWIIVVWSNSIILFIYCFAQQFALNKFLKSKLLH